MPPQADGKLLLLPSGYELQQTLTLFLRDTGHAEFLSTISLKLVRIVFTIFVHIATRFST